MIERLQNAHLSNWDYKAELKKIFTISAGVKNSIYSDKAVSLQGY